MTVGYESLDREVVDWAVRKGLRSRIVSLDLETKVVDGNFLANETVLSATISRRTGDVETTLYDLVEESPSGELSLLARLDELFLKIRPVIVVGFNHRGYDNILLSLKKKLLGKSGFWGIKDTLERAYMLDVMHAARFAVAAYDSTTPKMLSLAKVLAHPMFAKLPLKNAKSLVEQASDKGAQIYEMWKSDKARFRSYAEGDAHDTLLVFEQIFHEELAAKSLLESNRSSTP